MKQDSYCTLFDSNYLARAVTMYHSLVKHHPNAHLYIFAFDERTYKTLKLLSLQKATIISLEEFENEELLAVKQTRSHGEYCWTCTPSIIKYALTNFKLSHCTFLDADLYFFSSPAFLVEEMKDKNVSIIEHRYTPKYDQSELSGKYCVQFMTFKNNKGGMEVLEWWRKSCNEWCYAKPEEGKFGDQKYLDDWLTRFDGICDIKHLGAGVAPWNVQQYDILKKNNQENNQVCIQDKQSKKIYPVVFYHFHALRFLEGSRVDLVRGYTLERDAVKYLYQPYVAELNKIASQIKTQDGFDHHNHQRIFFNLKNYLRRKWHKTYNIYRCSQFSR